MQTDYTAYPPQVASDVEIVEQKNGERLSYIVGAATVGRYLILRSTEYQVFQLLNENLPPAALCEAFKQQHGATLPLAILTKFLTKLDEVGILAGERTQGYAAAELLPGQQFYHRFKLFDPDPLFTRLLGKLRWVWSLEFAVASLLLMFATLLLALMRWDEVTGYAAYTLGEHFIAICIASWLVVITHEFAHGLTCKAFGGRASEVGVLLIYYFLPALYCNVSGIHSITRRSQRLWVIAAGVYWQLLVGALALLAWFALAPHTALADLAFIFFLGSVLDVVFNANPLMKLDGYYFLSQWLRLPNLMGRSRAYWRSLLRRILFGEAPQTAERFTLRERRIYRLFGLLSFLYNLALPSIIIYQISNYLIDTFYFPGLLASLLIALNFARRPLKQLVILTLEKTGKIVAAMKGAAQASAPLIFSQPQTEASMAISEQTIEVNSVRNESADKTVSVKGKNPVPRRRLVFGGFALLVTAILLMPWRASVGSYGTLLALPEQETIIRAPESATLIALSIQPGQSVEGGASLGHMGNAELQEQIIQVETELARVNADYDRLLGELRTQTELAARAEMQLKQRQREFQESAAEQRQIHQRQIAEPADSAIKAIPISTKLSGASRPGNQPDTSAEPYPPALAVLQADLDLCRAKLAEALSQRERGRKLFAQGILSRSELEMMETRASSLAIELTGAQNRLDAALIEHQRKHSRSATDLDVADADLSAERLQMAKLNSELSATRVLIQTLNQRRELLQHKQAQFALVTPRAGAIFGEELPRLAGQYFQKGAEICRVADTSRLLVRINVPEREIGEVRKGQAVRVKARAWSDLTFQGVVTKIGAESERDDNNQPTYRVELTIENSEALLRPGMTAFARIETGRQILGQILLYKLKQALRPELWLF